METGRGNNVQRSISKSTPSISTNNNHWTRDGTLKVNNQFTTKSSIRNNGEDKERKIKHVEETPEFTKVTIAKTNSVNPNGYKIVNDERKSISTTGITSKKESAMSPDQVAKSVLNAAVNETMGGFPQTKLKSRIVNSDTGQINKGINEVVDLAYGYGGASEANRENVSQFIIAYLKGEKPRPSRYFGQNADNIDSEDYIEEFEKYLENPNGTSEKENKWDI